MFWWKRKPTQLDRIEGKVNQMALDLTKLTSDVASLKTAEASAITLLQGLKAAVDAIPPSTDPATQKALDDLSTQIESGTADLAAAVVANTPAAPPTT